jgi:hypothetical protein
MASDSRGKLDGPPVRVRFTYASNGHRAPLPVTWTEVEVQMGVAKLEYSDIAHAVSLGPDRAIFRTTAKHDLRKIRRIAAKKLRFLISYARVVHEGRGVVIEIEPGISSGARPDIMVVLALFGEPITRREHKARRPAAARPSGGD